MDPLDNWDANIGLPGVAPEEHSNPISFVPLGKKVVAGVGEYRRNYSIGGLVLSNMASWNGRRWESVPGSEKGFIGWRTTEWKAGLAALVFPNTPELQLNSGFQIAYHDGDQWNDIEGTPASRHVPAGLEVIEGGADGNLYVSGTFESISGIAANCIAMWNGTNWMALGKGIELPLRPNPDFPSTRPMSYIGNTRDMVWHDGALYVFGDIIKAGGKPAYGVARWDGQDWMPIGKSEEFAAPDEFPVLSYFTGSEPRTIHRGELYTCGMFVESKGGPPLYGIGRWDGKRWHLLPMNRYHDLIFRPTVGGMISDGDNLIIGGDLFYTSDRTPDRKDYLLPDQAKYMARWDGQQWHRIDPTPLGYISTMALIGDDLYLSGNFDGVGDQETGKIQLESHKVALWRIPRNLTIRSESNQLRIAWRSSNKQAFVESSSTLHAFRWERVDASEVLEDGFRVIRIPQPQQSRFFRLNY